MIAHAGGTGAKDDSLRFLFHLEPIQLVHVVAATLWLAVVLWVAVAYRDPARGAATARRLRTPAVGLFALTALSGYRNALPHFDFGSAWSWVLIGKLALVALAVLAAWRGRRAFAFRVEGGLISAAAAAGLFLGATAPMPPIATILASLPAAPSAACRAEIAGARLAARAVGGELQTFRSAGCGVVSAGVATDIDWGPAGRVAAESLARRNVSSARVVGDTNSAFVRGVRTVLPEGDGAIFVTTAAALAGVDTVAVPVVLAPWLLGSAPLRSDLNLLVAAHRDLTDNLAIDYRNLATKPSAAGLEGFAKYLAAVGGGAPTSPKPGLFAITRIEVMPPGLQHAAHGEWSKGLRLVRV